MCNAHAFGFGLVSTVLAASLSAAAAQDIDRQPLPAPSMPSGLAKPSLSRALPQALPRLGRDLQNVWPDQVYSRDGQPAQPAYDDNWATDRRAPLDGPPASVGLEQHLDRVQSVLGDQETIDPDVIRRASEMEWDQSELDLIDGDFAAPNDSSGKVGWVAPNRRSDAPKVRRPRIDLDSITKLRLNDKGSTYLDLTRGQVIHRW